MKKILLAGLVIGALVFAQDFELLSAKDAGIWSREPDSSFGTDPWLVIQGGIGSVDTAMSIICFDLEELPYTEDIVAQAVLRMWVLPDTDYIAGGHAGVYMAAEIWDETVTWNTMPLQDRSINRVGVLPPHSSLWFEQDITEMVHAWLYLDAENYGLYVEVPEGTPYAFPRFAAREYDEEMYRPRLAIWYSTDTEEDLMVLDYDLTVSSVSRGKVDVRFSLSRASYVSCKIYDVSGKLRDILLNGEVISGNHLLTRYDHEPGIYFLRFETPEYSATSKFIQVR